MGTLGSEQTDKLLLASGLRDELARGDRALSGVAPVLSHMLAAPGRQLVSEEICARIRGMLEDMASQLLTAAGQSDDGEGARDHIDALRQYLSTESAVLSHLFAAAMEWQLTERLEATNAVDPILNALLQELIAAEHAELAELAMKAMAAQSRFVQTQRRMQLRVTELPAELFNLVIRRAMVFVRETHSDLAPSGVQALKRNYSEGETRLGLLARLVKAMNQGAIAALDLEHAGFAFFASALGVLTSQPRELAILSCSDNQGARLALGLRATGLDTDAIENQFAMLGMSHKPPADLQSLPVETASSILSDPGKRR